MKNNTETLLNKFLYKRKMEEIILRAESVASRAGTDHMQILEEYAASLKKSEPTLSAKAINISRKLAGGGKRWNVYRDFLDQDILMLLKMASEKNITAGKIIEDYLPIKRITSEYRNTIKKNLVMPTAITLLVIIALGYVNGELKKIVDSGMMHISDTSYMLMDHFYLMNLSFVGFFAVLLFVFPRYVPILNKVYRELDAMQALALINTLLKVNYASIEIIPVLKKQFAITFSPKRQDIDGLIEILTVGKLVTALEAAELKVTTTQSDPKKAIEMLVNDRKKEAENLTQMAGKMVNTITLFMMATPILFMVSALSSMLQAAVALAQGAGG
ncbi:MAG: hypothetical protein PHT07_10505 [Paludibacter sp.]|nr:hypothetical protein [Paludibacter sp.]